MKFYGKHNRESYAIALILAVVLLSYFNALSIGFISDDRPQILANPNLRDWSDIIALLTSGVWQTEEFSGGLYRPLPFISWLLEYMAVGPSPFLYHLDNIALHMLCSFMVYLVAGKIAEYSRVGIFTALIFASHPVHTEAVDWIACRMELMYSFFTLTAFWVYVSRPRTLPYILLNCLLFMAGLLSKETAIVLPALILAYILLFERPEGGASDYRLAFQRLLPYAITAGIYIAIRLVVIGFEGGTSDIYSNYAALGAYDMFLVMCRSLYDYMRLSFLPFDLRNEYVFSPPGSILSPSVMLPLALAFMAAVLSRRIVRCSRLAFFSILLFFICLLPVSNIIPAGIVMAERALYLPLLGPSMLTALLIVQVEGRIIKPAHIGLVFFSVILAMFVLLTQQRNRFWLDYNPVMVIDIVKKRVEAFPDKAMNYRFLAGSYMDSGEFGQEAEKAIKTSLRLDPYDAESHYFYAKILSNRSMNEEALNETTTAISLSHPPKAEYFGFAGLLHQEAGRYEDAARMLDIAIKLGPDNDAYYTAKGNLFLEAGDDGNALELFREANRLNPYSRDAYLGMAIVQDAKGEHGKAIANLQKAVRMGPDDPDLRYFLAVSLARSGDVHTAVAELKKALGLRPGFRDASKLLETLETAGTGQPPGPDTAGR